MKVTKVLLAAFAAAALAAVSHAQALGDLVIGFSSYDASVTQDYEIDAGSISGLLSSAASGPVNLSSHISAADLSSAFGSNWNSSGIVSWGAVTTDGTSATKSIWFTDSASNYSVAAAPWTARANPTTAATDYSSLNASGRVGSVAPLINGGANTGALNNTGGANGPVLSSTVPGSFTQNASSMFTVLNKNTGTNSYQWGMNNKGGSPSGTQFNFIPATTTTALINSGSLPTGDYTVQNLFKVTVGSTSTTGTYVGSLELGSDGSLFFTNFAPTVSAIPEPSTYAAILGLAALGFVMIRRRQVIA